MEDIIVKVILTNQTNETHINVFFLSSMQETSNQTEMAKCMLVKLARTLSEPLILIAK